MTEFVFVGGTDQSGAVTFSTPGVIVINWDLMVDDEDHCPKCASLLTFTASKRHPTYCSICKYDWYNNDAIQIMEFFDDRKSLVDLEDFLLVLQDVAFNQDQDEFAKYAPHIRSFFVEGLWLNLRRFVSAATTLGHKFLYQIYKARKEELNEQKSATKDQ